MHIRIRIQKNQIKIKKMFLQKMWTICLFIPSWLCMWFRRWKENKNATIKCHLLSYMLVPKNVWTMSLCFYIYNQLSWIDEKIFTQRQRRRQSDRSKILNKVVRKLNITHVIPEEISELCIPTKIFYLIQITRLCKCMIIECFKRINIPHELKIQKRHKHI